MHATAAARGYFPLAAAFCVRPPIFRQSSPSRSPPRPPAGVFHYFGICMVRMIPFRRPFFWKGVCSFSIVAHSLHFCNLILRKIILLRIILSWQTISCAVEWSCSQAGPPLRLTFQHSITRFKYVLVFWKEYDNEENENAPNGVRICNPIFQRITSLTK